MSEDNKKWTSRQYNVFRQTLVSFADTVKKDVLSKKSRVDDSSFESAFNAGMYVDLANYKCTSKYVHYKLHKQDKGARVFPNITSDKHQYGVHHMQIGIGKRSCDVFIQVPVWSAEYPIYDPEINNLMWGYDGLNPGSGADPMVFMSDDCPDDGEVGHLVRMALVEATKKYDVVEERLKSADIIINSLEGDYDQVKDYLDGRVPTEICTEELKDMAEMIVFKGDHTPQHWIKRAYSRGLEIKRRREYAE